MRQLQQKFNGVQVKTVSRHSPFYDGGVRAGDRILKINGEPVFDELDFQYFSAEADLVIECQRSGTFFEASIERPEGSFSGVTLVEDPIHRCANRCIFCFIDQMPKGLRKTLYIKDEDIRLSMMSGNYVTMSNFRHHDLERIVRIGLSPLYVSVHATDSTIRRSMLGNWKAPDILEQLDFLSASGIRFHTQIVVCPGYNDGTVLKKTIKDLLRYNDSVRSIAVVPVGLTKFSNSGLAPVYRADARKICAMVNKTSDAALRKDGMRKLFLADEFFIKAGDPIPDAMYYEDYPQIENGVGLIRQMLDLCSDDADNWKSSAGKMRKRTMRRLVVTSVSAEHYLQQAAAVLSGKNSMVAFRILPVLNNYFGASVSVAGLLTATDVIQQVKMVLDDADFDEVILPEVMFNFAGHTLDGYSPERIMKLIGRKVRTAALFSEVFK